MKESNLILDEEFLENEKSNKKEHKIFNIFYVLSAIGLWIINFVWLSFIDKIGSTHIEILNKWADIIFFSTIIGYVLTGFGFSKKFKVNKWILLVGIISLIVSSYLLCEPILFYFYD